MDGTSWTKTFGGTKNDYSYCIKQINRYEFVIAGTTDSFGAGESDGRLIRFRLTKVLSKAGQTNISSSADRYQLQ